MHIFKVFLSDSGAVEVVLIFGTVETVCSLFRSNGDIICTKNQLKMYFITFLSYCSEAMVHLYLQHYHESFPKINPKLAQLYSYPLG